MLVGVQHTLRRASASRSRRRDAKKVAAPSESTLDAAAPAPARVAVVAAVQGSAEVSCDGGHVLVIAAAAAVVVVVVVSGGTAGDPASAAAAADGDDREGNDDDDGDIGCVDLLCFGPSLTAGSLSAMMRARAMIVCDW